MKKRSKKYQIGGDTKELKDAKAFYTEYLNSPNYTKRLQGMGYTNPQATIKSRLNQLKNTSYLEIPNWINGSEFNTQYNRVIYDPEQAKQYGFSKEDVKAHEMSHGSGAIGNHFFENKMLNPLTLNRKEINTLDSKNKYIDQTNPNNVDINNLHDSMSAELKADMDTLRYRLKKDKIYDTGNQQFNSDYLKKAKDKYKNDPMINRVFNRVNDKDLIYLMNNIAQNDNTQTEPTTAKIGGNMARNKAKKPKYYVAQVGGNIVNNTVEPDMPFSKVTTPLADIGDQSYDTANALPYNPTAGPGVDPNTAIGMPTNQKRRLTTSGYLDAINGTMDAVTSVADRISDNQLARREQQQQLRNATRYTDAQQGPLNTRPAYTQAGGKYQVGGQVPDDGETYSDYDDEDYSGDQIMDLLKAGGWIKGAVNPKHKGYCTPMTKSTCTPRRKALARTFKKHHGFHKSKLGGDVNEWDDMGMWSTYDDEDYAFAQVGLQVNPTRPFAPGFVAAKSVPGFKKAQAGGSQFTSAEQGLVDRYTQLGYTVSKDPNSGQLKYVKNGVTANPQTAQANTQKIAAAQAATGNTQAPVQQATPQQTQSAQAATYPSKEALRKKYANNKYLADQGRYNRGNQLDTNFLTGQQENVRQSVYAAARQNNVNPSLLYSSAMEEGMSGRLSAKNAGDVSSDFPDALAETHPIDGFLNYGLDQFGDQAKALEKKGYLPQGFSSRVATYKTKNEKGESLNAPAFESDSDALMAKSAMMRQAQDQLNSYTKKSGVKLSPKQQDFFMLANYNGGEGNMQKMIQSYKDKGYLANDNFITDQNFKPASYAGIYGNVQARLQTSKQMNDEGYFNDYNTQNQSASAGQSKQTGMQFGGALKFKSIGGNAVNDCGCDADQPEMKAGGGLSRKKDYGSKSHPYPMVKGSDFAGGHRSYPIPTRADAIDALRLAHLHHRSDVIAKVHSKYPGLKQFGGIGGTGREDLDVDDMMQFKSGGHWIQGAIKHPGRCSNPGDSRCPKGSPQYNLAMRFKHGDLHKHQAGGITEVEGLEGGDQRMANVEAERGEVYTDQSGNINQVDTSGATHEQGGEKLPEVSRVLENTSSLRKDKTSKYLKLNPQTIKALTGLDTNRSMSHAEVMVKASENLEKQKQNIVNKMDLSTKFRKGIGLDNYAENSAKLNIDHFRAIPTQEELFNRLFDHQEMVKGVMGINNDGTQTAKIGGKYAIKAQVGINAYPGNKSGQKTPAGNSDAFPDNRQLADYLQELKDNGVKFDNIHSNADLQNAVYSYALKNNPQALRGMWKEGIQNYGMDKAVKAGLVYDKNDSKTGAVRGQFKPGVLDDPKNLQKLSELYPDNILGRRLIDLAKGTGPKIWTDDDVPPIAATPVEPNSVTPTFNGNLRLKTNPQSGFNEPLRWYDTASALGTYMGAQRRLAEPFNAPEVHQITSKLLDPTAALAANQEDYQAAVQAVNQANPYDIGTQMANISNLTSRKYALNNQVVGNFENQNAAIKNQEIQYNAQAKDRQSASDAQVRTNYADRVNLSKAKQQEQKLTALDSLYKTVAENAALNRNGNLIMKLSKAFDQYGNYNGYAPTFQPNPTLGIPNNQPATGKYQPAGGVQALTPGKTYYNRRTGKTLRFDGSNLVELK